MGTASSQHRARPTAGGGSPCRAGECPADDAAPRPPPAPSTHVQEHTIANSDRVSSQSADGKLLELSPELLGSIMDYLSPLEAHRVVTSPLSRAALGQVAASRDVWATLCLGAHFCVPQAHLADASEAQCRRYHLRLVKASLVVALEASPTVEDIARVMESLPEVYGIQLKCLRQLVPDTGPPVGPPAPTEAAAARAAVAASPAGVAAVPRGAVAPMADDDASDSDDGLDDPAPATLTTTTSTAGTTTLTICAAAPPPSAAAARAATLAAAAAAAVPRKGVLEDYAARRSAQQSPLTNLVVAALRAFPGDVELAVLALHSLVLLARPMGGSEGMVFHRGLASPGIEAFLGGDPAVAASAAAAADADAAAAAGGSNRGGIAAVLDCMRRHAHVGPVQAMGCWSLVNIALNPAQKRRLLREGGLAVVVACMANHPLNFEVQFRALFSMINIVIPDGPAAEHSYSKVICHVVRAMQTFGHSEPLVNRACLVLHNLSLYDCNHGLLVDEGAVSLLRGAMRRHPLDPVVQQSSIGTLRRLEAPEPDHGVAVFSGAFAAPVGGPGV